MIVREGGGERGVGRERRTGGGGGGGGGGRRTDRERENTSCTQGRRQPMKEHSVVTQRVKIKANQTKSCVRICFQADNKVVFN